MLSVEMLTTNLKVLIYGTKVAYKNSNPYYLLLYIYYHFWKAYCESNYKTFEIKRVSDSFWHHKLLINSSDINTTIVVSKRCFFPNNSKTKCALLLVEDEHKIITKRTVQVATSSVCKRSEIISSDTLYHNLLINKSASSALLVFKLKPLSLKSSDRQFADEVEVSLINSPHDYTHAVVDALLKSYFKCPKLVRENDLIQVDFRQFGEEIFYSLNENKIVDINQSLFFKCNKVIITASSQNLDDSLGYWCAVGKTTLKQSANIQSFIPRKYSSSYLCPDGLDCYLQQMERAVKPFITSRHQRVNRVKPIFLLQGNKGCGKSKLVRSLAAAFGMHLYNVFNIDLLANIYAQNESKMRTMFFNAKMTAPCILAINNFENFGKNNEGHYDERIMNCFVSELQSGNLFDANPFPIIVICCCNEKLAAVQLKRVFLETFQVDAPDERQREQLLRWIILEEHGFDGDVSSLLHEVANKTHGFFYGDLQALVYYAFNNRKLNPTSDVVTKADITLDKYDFMKALDHMQSNYKESLGAPRVPQVYWSDVGGLNSVKDQIIKTINLPLKYPKLLKKTALKRSGILLFGPPGTGKTLIAKAVATECGLCFLSVKGPELLNMYVGQSEQNIREVFERARQAAPCIIFFDELDSLAPNRGAAGDSGGVMDRVVSQMLAEMDGLNETATIFVVGATNRPDLIDPALLRPGRFDKLLYVGPCTDDDSKLSILTALTRKFKLSADFSLDRVVELCPDNITGADFYGICSTAWTSAVTKLIQSADQINLGPLSQEDVIVDLDDFKHAIVNLKPSITPEDLKYFEKLKLELGSN